jgi:hypothetical protein
MTFRVGSIVNHKFKEVMYRALKYVNQNYSSVYRKIISSYVILQLRFISYRLIYEVCIPTISECSQIKIDRYNIYLEITTKPLFFLTLDIFVKKKK